MLLTNHTKRPLHVCGLPVPPNSTVVGDDDKRDRSEKNLFVRTGWVTISDGNEVPDKPIVKEEPTPPKTLEKIKEVRKESKADGPKDEPKKESKAKAKATARRAKKAVSKKKTKKKTSKKSS